MNIYFVTRWGNDKEGVNEADTNFIVLAPNQDEAAEVVDAQLQKVENSKARSFCQRITELGVSHGEVHASKIILGPTLEHALYHDDIGIPNNKKWVRDTIDEGWIDYAEYYED